MGLSNPVEIAYVLYSEPNWKKWQKAIVKAGAKDYKNHIFGQKFDGYSLFVGMYFDNLKNDGDTIGVALPLPNGSGEDLSGFGFKYDAKTTNYVGFSYFVPSGVSADLTIDSSWLCGSAPMDT